MSGKVKAAPKMRSKDFNIVSSFSEAPCFKEYGKRKIMVQLTVTYIDLLKNGNDQLINFKR